ncbi:ester cyclase [Flavitalea flava]
MHTNTDQNKAIVIRFNKEVLEQGNRQTFDELIADEVINHEAPPGTSKGPDGMIHFLWDILRTGFPDIKVEILEQVAEKDLVTTRKRFTATHTGEIMGIPPSHKKVSIKVIDMIRLQNGKFIEHWGISNLQEVLAQLSEK